MACAQYWRRAPATARVAVLLVATLFCTVLHRLLFVPQTPSACRQTHLELDIYLPLNTSSTMYRAFGIGQRNDAAQHSYTSRSWAGQDQAHSEDIDGSEALFTMYMERAWKEDKEKAERWKADADSILVFSGLFSATVAAAIGLTFPDLKQNPQDSTNFYLFNIYQLLASSTNGTHIIIPTTLPKPPAFSPPASAVWVNVLWFLSLFSSLVSALFAVMLQQWSHLYLTTYHTPHTLLKEARIRELLAEGIKEFNLPFMADVLRTLHHFSFFLFLAGLLVLLFNINFMVFWCMALSFVIFNLEYMRLTFVPMFRINCPYSTPFSQMAWHCILIALLVPRLIARFTCPGFEFTSLNRLVVTIYRRRPGLGITRAAEESAQTRSQELDGRALLWTFKTLSEDQELERFVAGIPSFCGSKAVEDPLNCFVTLADNGLSDALFSLMHRTLTSNLVSQSVKQRRIRACTKAIDAAPVLETWSTLRRVFGEWDGLLGSLDLGRSVARIIGNTGNDPRTDFYAQCIVAVIITHSQEDGGWSDLATTLLGVSDDALVRYNIGGRTNVLLATLILVVRRSVRLHFHPHSWTPSSNMLALTLDELLLRNIDVRRASPELQQDFCGVWNELVHSARDGAGIHRQSTATEILRRIRKCYIAFHENTDPNTPSQFYETTDNHDLILSLGSAYPLCNVQGHHPIPLPPAPESSEGNTDTAVTQGTSSTAPTIVHPIPLAPIPESSEENTDAAVAQGTSSTTPTIVHTAHHVQDATVRAVSDSLTPSTSRFQPPS